MRESVDTSVSDGVVAFADGDYRRAAGILKPLAERARTPDLVAALFTSMLYDAGLGLPQDRVRACAHYMRAGEPRDTTPYQLFGSVATWLLSPSIIIPGNQEAVDDCTRMATEGFNAHFSPATFQLENGYWVDWDAKGQRSGIGERRSSFRTSFSLAAAA